MNDHYILVGQTPVPCDLFEWARSCENYEQRRVGYWQRGPVRISTIFLGIDQNMERLISGRTELEPHLFETMIFFSHAPVWQDRCATWTEAEAMHGDALRYLFTVWRRPRELAGWIQDGIDSWMRLWDHNFTSRYGTRLRLRGED